ncbi:UTP--glucose-1-phosphate uridylyltransferase [Nematocida homosporus]|uniref:UTP--glucose-1-phosphate uridylyltransferase n=1 Tax=Nematocida homosporus TaxID=1912981 RepID=UPI002220EDA4|nr:UTP--glucose-1-phosphate uridylyltransferase [Nematocida homosporus]KAI5185769.1 UTP--glucose-1-phosphate uridylyltransferase [Nematocida homosporus]
MDDSTNNELTPSRMKETPEEAIARIDTVFEFKQRGSDSLLVLMQQELEGLQKQFESKSDDMKKFFTLFSQYLRTRSNKLDWEKIAPPPKPMIIDYEASSPPAAENIADLLSKLAVLKLNGGLGTSMGCTGPKSAIEVKDHLNFIDLSVRQIEHLNSAYGTEVPIILMNSFNTSKQTAKLISKYKNVWTFEQSAFPRIYSDTLLPVLSDSTNPASAQEGWYPPGHGDLFSSLQDSGMLDKLLAEGKEYLFVSNIDNLRSVVDLAILNYITSEKIDFLMEVTEKTRADIKGGTLVDYNGELRLLEIAQVPEYHKTDFTSIRKFKIFNTNSLWISLKAIKEVLESTTLELEVIENKKKLSTGEEIIQLETAVGASIRYFSNSKGMVVPRDRFLPVKTCSDLFLLQSSLFQLKHGSLSVSGKRTTDTIPIIRLVGKHFKSVSEFRKRVAGPIVIDDLDHLTISGDVKLGRNVVLKGTVIIIAAEGQAISIPDGTVLDDKIVTGSLFILDH